ncbi:hypothetical protein HY496_00105 [Candidatus Woesearchaeota archaeon]|nr:hypothetical protein [Candidatus Woesearchaeota archaeon]
MTKYPYLPRQDSHLEYLDKGSFGSVYVVSHEDDLVGKVLHDYRDYLSPYLSRLMDKSIDEELRWEYAMAQRLYDEGVSVPQPHGLYTIRMPSPGSSLIERPAFVMERVYGIKIFQLEESGSTDWPVAHSLLCEEIQKVRSLGFNPIDFSDGANAFYLPVEQRVVLFDFGFWSHPEIKKEKIGENGP